MKERAALRTWLATKGIVIGLISGLPVLVALMIFGVNFGTILALVICGGLILAGIFAFSGPAGGKKQTDDTGEGGD